MLAAALSEFGRAKRELRAEGAEHGTTRKHLAVQSKTLVELLRLQYVSYLESLINHHWTGIK